jgi:hypothetical protein
MSYSLTLHKKSYLLKGITKDDPNKEKVKEVGAKWNSGLGGWLFFPDKHKDGLKFAKKIGAEINIDVKEEKTPKKESVEKKENEEFEALKEKFDKLKLKYKKLKKEKQKLEDRVDRMDERLGRLGEDTCEDEKKEDESLKCVECDEILSFGICENEDCKLFNSTFHIET